MLSKIKYKGFEIASSQFVEHKDIDGGHYDVSLEQSEFSSGCDEEENKSWAQMVIQPSVFGYEEDSGSDSRELAFEVKLKVYIFFEIEGKEIISEEFFEENSWFFENFLAISIKLAVESVLKNTPLHTIKLPWSVPSDFSLMSESGSEEV